MDNSKELLLIETMVKLAAINKLLVKKNLLTDQEIQEEMTNISKELVEQMKNLPPEIFDNTTKN